MKQQMGDNEAAKAYYIKGSQMPHDYCYPFRAEESKMLLAAIEMVPTDAKAHYYLGNLYYEHQPERAVALWERSRELDGTFYITHRNLALAYRDLEQDYAKALTSINMANKYNNSDPRLLFETDVINNLNGLSAKEKYEFLIKNRKTAEKHYETLLRLITRAVEYGKYDEALDLLDNNDIIESEGAREKQSAYLNSYALKAWNLLGRGRASAALDVMEKALNYPVGLYGRAQYAQLYYITAAAYEKKGDKAKATEYYNMAVNDVEIGYGADREYLYYIGLAQKALGQMAEAEKTFNSLLAKDDFSNAMSQFGGTRTASVTQQAQDYYFSGLGHLGLGNAAEAMAAFAKALELNSGLIWARTLGGIK